MSDADLGSFLKTDFDPEAYTAKLLTSSQSVEDHVSQLNVTMSDLDRQLRQQIRTHHEDLLSHATSVETAEDILQVLTEHIHILDATMDRIVARMDAVYTKAETRTRQLERLHNVSNMVRAIMRIITVSGRLDGLEQGPDGQKAMASKDLVKAASLVQEMQHILEEEDLTGISVVEQPMSKVKTRATDILKQAREILFSALTAPNHGNMSKVKTRATDILKQAREILFSALTAPNHGNMSKVKTRATDILKQAREILFSALTAPNHGNMSKVKTRATDILKQAREILFSALTAPNHGNMSKVKTRATDILKQAREILFSALTAPNHGNMSKVKTRATDILKQAREILFSALTAPNHGNVSMALQVFHNMTILKTEMKCWQTTWIDEMGMRLTGLAVKEQKSSSDAARNPGKSSLAPSSSSAAIRASLWSNVEAFADYLLTLHGKCAVLSEVMHRKKTDGVGVTFAQEYAVQEWNNALWQGVTAKIVTVLEGDLNAHAKAMLENEYPKFLRQMEFVINKLSASTIFDDQDDLDETSKSKSCGQSLRNAFICLENAYLSKSVARLFDGINLAFAETAVDVPSKQEITEIVRTMSNELHAVKFEPSLFGRVGRNVVKAINLYNVKSEGLLVTDGDSSQIVDKPNPTQKKNARVISQLNVFRDAVLKGMAAFEGSFQQELLDDLLKNTDNALDVMTSGLEPVTDSFLEAISAIVTSMHQEDFSGDDADNRQCSLFMRELQNFIARTTEEHFSSIFADHCRGFILQRTTEIARQTAEIFIHHSVLVRPLSESGKLRLAADYAQMELALSPLCRTVADMGKSYDLLRDMRPLFFQSPPEIANNALVGSRIPYSLVLHLLISLSPPQLLSPHESAEWSLSRYSEWLLTHRDERDRLSFLKGTLEAYVKMVHSSGTQSFADTYPIIIDLMKRAMNQ